MLKSHLRSCAICGLSSGKVELLCKDCWKNLQALQLEPHRTCEWLEDLPSFSWMEWGEDNDRLVSTLVYSLKNGRNQGAFDQIADLLVKRLYFHFSPWLTRRPLFIPSPPQKVGERDHAVQLAEAFAAVTGGEILHALKRPQGQKTQRRQARRQRSETLLERLEPVQNLRFLPGRAVIFVDDVITTGSTAQAAYKALGSPAQFAIWTLFRRRLLLNEGGFDILRQ